MLVERGWTLAAASSATSLVLWLVAVSVPLGGILADRSGRPIMVLVFGLVSFALALIVAMRTDLVVAGFVALGLVGGLAAGPVMSLPARVLQPHSRSIGMGLFFTMFYLVQLAAPWLAGAVAAWRGTASITFDLGALLQVCGLLLLAAFWSLQRQWRRPSSKASVVGRTS